MKGRVTAGAKVTMTVEIGALGSWGPDCTMAQIESQAAEAAVNRMRRLLSPPEEGRRWENPHVKIIGEPKVTAVMAREEE